MTFYDALGVEKNCATDEIRRAYRKKALETHPDKLEPTATEEEKEDAEKQFHKVHEAFETLGDPQKRRRYDALLAFRSDPVLISEESARRSADRREWARQQQEMAQRRIGAFKITPKPKQNVALPRVVPSEKEQVQSPPKPKPKSKPETKPKPKPEPSPEPRLNRVADVLQDLMSANPEFAARREAVLKRKAERERIEKEKAASQRMNEPS